MRKTHFVTLITFVASIASCSAKSTPTGVEAYASGRAAADGGMPSACASASCPQGAMCSVACVEGVADYGCHVPEPAAVAPGEECTGNVCREGLCGAGPRDLSPHCVSFCVSDSDCATGERCQTRDVSYACQNGRIVFKLAVCLLSSTRP